jgi:prepilin-type N-terminal cleavage/methylation domain-containing protein/prepilin-type processing-associated H-X9-DG protein
MKIRAFTLIELLVVIAIIAILMAILLPSLRLAKDQAYAIRCVGNIKSLTFSWLLYKDDFDAKMIGGHVGGTQDNKLIDWVDTPPTGTGDPIEIKQAAIKRGLLWPYIKNFDVYRCPADQRITRHNQDAFRSYSISGPMFGEERFTNWTGRALWTYVEINAPALKYVFVEEIDPRGHNMGSWVMDPAGNSWIDPLAIWHNKRSTFSYADGSAEKHRWLNQLTMDMAAIAAEGIQSGAFSQTPPAGEREDIEFMHRGYQLWPTVRRYQDRH